MPGYKLLSRVYRHVSGRGARESYLERIRDGAVTTLDEIRAHANPYPTEILAGRDSALVLFGAAFLGVNDVIHMANAGISYVTVVDIDIGKLGTMRTLYRDDWEFVAADALAFAETQHQTGAHYDVVSVDPFTNLMPRCRTHLPTFCALARHSVVLGIERDLPFDSPGGWRGRRFERSDDLADWIVLERE